MGTTIGSAETSVFPRYLDLGYYASKEGVPFTLNSNLMHALHTAATTISYQLRYSKIRDLSQFLTGTLRSSGFRVLAPDQCASPAVITIVLPAEVSSEKTGDMLESAGYLLSYKSGYLLQRSWIQICLMGGELPDREAVAPALQLLEKECAAAIV